MDGERRWYVEVDWAGRTRYLTDVATWALADDRAGARWWPEPELREAARTAAAYRRARAWRNEFGAAGVVDQDGRSPAAVRLGADRPSAGPSPAPSDRPSA